MHIYQCNYCGNRWIEWLPLKCPKCKNTSFKPLNTERKDVFGYDKDTDDIRNNRKYPSTYKPIGK